MTYKSSVDEIIGFHLPTETHGCFSNWFHSGFTYAGIYYTCAEQYMMAQKVSLGKRYDLQKQIMQTSDPSKIKDLGGRNYFLEFAKIEKIWFKNSKHIVKRGVKAKFQQNPDILQELLDTGEALLCECSRQDKIWGIGINLRDSSWHDINKWNGNNQLGVILMEVRDELRSTISEKGNVCYIDFKNSKAIPEWKLTVKHLKRIPQYYDAIHAYADQIPAGQMRENFYGHTFENIEFMIRDNKNEEFPLAGFYEMKQEIYEIAHELRHNLFVSDIFSDEPDRWGLRGDPYFWETLKEEFAFDDISMTEQELSEKVHEIFKQKTQVELTEDATCYLEEYDKLGYGMSAGCISGDWIVNECIPMLQERLRELRKNRKGTRP